MGRTVLLALLLLLRPVAGAAQDLDAALTALARISGTRAGTPVRGSGFVVGLDRDKATIVTASHVIEGVEQLEVTFAVDPTTRLHGVVVLGMDAGNPQGLAVFQVRGSLPAGLAALAFEVEKKPRLGDSLFLLGFPQMATAPRATQRVLAQRSGTLLLIDQPIGEGFSGGPVLLQGKVVGVVTDTDEQTTYAVAGSVVREAIEGWGGRVGQLTATVTKPAPQSTPDGRPSKVCVPGEELNTAGLVFVRICGGTFTMGSTDADQLAFSNEKPARQVKLSEFWMSKTEITNGQYRQFRPGQLGEEAMPVTGVTWDEAKKACERFGGSLPTEAQWEYAARAGSVAAWSFGDEGRMLGDYAWFAGNSGNTLHPVGLKIPNAWGLHDMHGNAAEWVADRFGTYPSAAQSDPSGPKKGGAHILRGGSFTGQSRSLRSAFRDWSTPDFQYGSIGFRCVLSSPR